MKTTKPWPFNNGYLDAKLGIETFKPNDKWSTFAQFKESMLLAADKCEDREYAKGLRYAFQMIRYQGR